MLILYWLLDSQRECKVLFSGSLSWSTVSVHIQLAWVICFSFILSLVFWLPHFSVSRRTPGTAQSPTPTDINCGSRASDLEFTNIRISWKWSTSSGAHGGRRSGGTCSSSEPRAHPFWSSPNRPYTCPRDKCTQVRDGGNLLGLLTLSAIWRPGEAWWARGGLVRLVLRVSHWR